jgi:hypothetical protein
VPQSPQPPTWIKPQLTRLVDEAPEGTDWLHEIKYDGYRMHARIDGDKIQLVTRTGLDWSHRYKRTIEALRSLRVKSAYLDDAAGSCGDRSPASLDGRREAADCDGELEQSAPGLGDGSPLRDCPIVVGDMAPSVRCSGGRRIRPAKSPAMKNSGQVQMGTATLFCSRYISLMAGVILNKSELRALAAVDGTRAQPEMSRETRLRLYDLGLIERREWPNGSLWRTDLGNRHVRRGYVLVS